jgi:general secretion pathway protein L
MSRTRILWAPPAPDAAPLVVVVDADGHVLERGTASLAAGAGAPMRTVLITPGVEAVSRWLHLPTRNDRQARAAARLALEDQLASGDQDVHVALGALEPDGRRLVVVVGGGRLRGWLETAGLYGLRPDVVIPDHLAVAAAGDVVRGVQVGPTVAVRGDRLAFSAEPDLLDLLLEGQPLEMAASAETAERWLIEGALRPPLNLLQDAFDPARAVAVAPRELRRAAALAALLAISPVVLTAAGLARDSLAAQRIEQRTARVLARAAPGVGDADPLPQLDARLAQARAAAGGGPMALAASLFSAIEPIEHGQVERLILMPDGAARATLSYTNYSDIELMRVAMRKAGIAMREEGAREEQGRVISDVILGARS